ncbi:MAG: oligosaccharide flippase family protein [Putridiphycobacter sp.]
MQKTFLSNLILIVILNLLVKPFFILGIDAEVQNRVGTEIYGNYFALLNFSFLLNIALDLGITNYNSRNIAQHPQLIQKHFGKLLSIRLMLFLLYATFTLGTGLIVGYSMHQFYLLSFLVVNQFFVATIQFSRSNFAGLHLFKIDAFISVLDRVLLILICSFLLWAPMVKMPFKIEWFIYAQTLTYGLSALISIIMLKFKIERFKLNLKKTFSIAIIKQSFPYALLILLMMFYNRIDSVMLERLLPDGNTQAGIYAQGFRFLDAVNMFALLFAGLLLPIFARMLKKREDISDLLLLGVSTLIPISLIIGITAFFHKDYLIELRYDTNIKAAGLSFGYLILSFIAVSFTYLFGTLLTANGSLKQLNLMAIGGLILNIILNFILIPTLKSEGAAIATLITQIFTAGIQVILVVKIFKLKPNYGIILKLILMTLIIISLNFALTYGNLSASKSLLISMFGASILPFILRIIQLKSIFKLLKSKS